jgi:hypothetical protein
MFSKAFVKEWWHNDNGKDNDLYRNNDELIDKEENKCFYSIDGMKWRRSGWIIRLMITKETIDCFIKNIVVSIILLLQLRKMLKVGQKKSNLVFLIHRKKSFQIESHQWNESFTSILSSLSLAFIYLKLISILYFCFLIIFLNNAHNSLFYDRRSMYFKTCIFFIKSH